MRRRDRFSDARSFDRYKLHEMFLWGALSALHPQLNVRGPANPVLLTEYLEGSWAAHRGYIRVTADFDPSSFIARLKRDHELRRENLIAPMDCVAASRSWDWGIAHA